MNTKYTDLIDFVYYLKDSGIISDLNLDLAKELVSDYLNEVQTEKAQAKKEQANLDYFEDEM